MKTKKILLLFVLAFLTGLFQGNAQNIVKTSAEHKISGKAGKPGALIDFVVDEAKKEISIKYLTKDNKRKIKYETYLYDLETLKEKKMEESEIEKERARKLFRRYDGGELMRFVRVKNNISGQMVLERGYVERQVGDGWATTRFVSEQKEKFKDPQNRRQSMVAYRTDAPSYAFNFNTWSDAFQRNATTVAKGNALILTMVKPKKFQAGEFSPGTIFNSMVVASENFSIVTENQIKFEFPHYPVTGMNLPDGGIAIVLRPMNSGALAGYSVHMAEAPVKENLKEYTLLTIDGQGKETGRYPFEVKNQNIDMDITFGEDGGYILYGYSDGLDVGAKDKKANMMPFNSGDFQAPLIESGVSVLGQKSIEIIKVSKDGKQVFAASTPLQKLLGATVSNKDEKVKYPKAEKWDKYFGKEAGRGGICETNGNFYLQFASKKFYQLAQFDSKGQFVVSYFTEKEGDIFVQNQVTVATGKTVYWMNFEHKEGKPGETWMKISHIDPQAKAVNACETPGDQKYYILGDYSFAPSPGTGNVILYLQSGKKTYLGKLPIE